MVLPGRKAVSLVLEKLFYAVPHPSKRADDSFKSFGGWGVGGRKCVSYHPAAPSSLWHFSSAGVRAAEVKSLVRVLLWHRFQRQAGKRSNRCFHTSARCVSPRKRSWTQELGLGLSRACSPVRVERVTREKQAV